MGIMLNACGNLTQCSPSWPSGTAFDDAYDAATAASIVDIVDHPCFLEHQQHLQRQMKQASTAYKIVDVCGDGNCMLYALTVVRSAAKGHLQMGTDELKAAAHALRIKVIGSGYPLGH